MYQRNDDPTNCPQTPDDACSIPYIVDTMRSINNKVIDNIEIMRKDIYMGNEEIVKYVVIDRGIRFGKPCIKGTRITVGDILQWLSEGIPISEILDDYPLLKEVHIKAALAFAARREEIVRVLTVE